MKVRCQHKGGQGTLDLPDDGTVADMLRAVAECSGIPEGDLLLKSGFPLKPLDTSNGETTLKSIGMCSGESVRAESGGSGHQQADTPPPPAQAGAASGSQPKPATPSHPVPAGGAKKAGKEKPPPGAMSTVPENLDAFFFESGKIVKRVIPADNSCLFNAVQYAAEGDKSRDGAFHLRRAVASAIEADPEEYSDAVLGKSNEEYRSWILDTQNWGGGIELAILSKIYQVEMACVNVENLRMDRFGEGAGYPRRIYLIYDGIHYDALALSLGDEEGDVTVFSPDDKGVEERVEKVAADLLKAHQFTNTAKFTLKCLVCGQGVVGEGGAQKHAMASGHANFGEYAPPK